ncbi:hypothetical protein ACFQAT_28510 [Undibacterium arcticum]|uniref:plasmid mobilization protein n=1 Tax=Undibacterium arcticum TaxID=1762892 RepID=UPI0036148017
MRFKKSANPKSARIVVYATPEDKQLIDANAREAQLSVSEYLINVGLSRKIKSQIEQHVINEVRTTADLLRDLFQRKAVKRYSSG